MKLGVVSYNAKKQHDLRSISKSVVSLLMGLAVDRKVIGSVDLPVLPFFPELAALSTPEKDRIKLRHLLTMSSGFVWDERRPYTDPENGERMMIGSADPYRFIFERPMSQEPGTHWNYSGGDTQLLAGVVERATGKGLTDFARESLFEPLGITQFEWVRMPASGERAAASGLRLRPRDMAKIGQLVLGKGLWNGRRIISESWIIESTTAHVSLVESVGSDAYGFQWWVDQANIGDVTVSWISAMGLGGQRIFIVPAYDLVLVVTAGLYSSRSQDSVPLTVLERVLGAIRR
jgi:CubicO group peptidase (beta-lactamase class C family)